MLQNVYSQLHALNFGNIKDGSGCHENESFSVCDKAAAELFFLPICTIIIT